MRRVQGNRLDDRARGAGSAGTSLDVQALPARLRAAAAEHDQLLARVARRREVRAQLEQDGRAAATHVATRIIPFFEEAKTLEEEIHAMLEALADDPKRPRAMRAKIRYVHQDLIMEGIIAPRGVAWPGEGGSRVEEQIERGDEQEPAPTKPRPADRDVLRGLFRRLAETLHPDKVQDEVDKVRRTEVMKQVTVAYQEGDYARLVEIERAWAMSGAAIAAGAEDDVERRLVAMERANAELRTQLKQIEREIRALRASVQGKLAKELKRDGHDEEMASELQEELEQRREVRDFIRAFRDGKMSFDEFLEGPRGDDDDELELDADVLAAAMRDFGIDLRPAAGRGAGARRGKSRRRRRA